jgi:hypothetical protein
MRTRTRLVPSAARTRWRKLRACTLLLCGRASRRHRRGNHVEWPVCWQCRFKVGRPRHRSARAAASHATQRSAASECAEKSAPTKTRSGRLPSGPAGERRAARTTQRRDRASFRDSLGDAAEHPPAGGLRPCDETTRRRACWASAASTSTASGFSSAKIHPSLPPSPSRRRSSSS